MPLSTGDRLGPYEILAPIGAGGMGEVYRARDTRLKRDVALKVLPNAFARDPERMARFQREAEALAALNHPGIAMIFGLEDRAIVMELVEGPTLADRLETGPLPLKEALKIAGAIAEALEAAHEKGIVHRDLKPANVKAPAEGSVKVLDFGLATAAQAAERASVDPANSPTLTMGGTEAGIILGTADYMSPEQASGRRVDRRADIWSFGVVLWEMLTGKRLFAGGETVSHTLADVLRAEIDFTRLPATTPGPIRELLARCLDRDVKTRLRDIGEARVAIQRWLANPVSAVEPTPGHVGRWHDRPLPWIVAATALLAAIALAAAHFRETAPDPRPLTTSILPPEGTIFDFSSRWGLPALSPDGRRIVFAARSADGKSPLWVRSLDSLRAQMLNGTEGAIFPFWSPDSRSVGFFADAKLKKIDVSGGPPLTLADAPLGRGGSWSPNGIIVFGISGGSPILRVSAAGGAPTPATAPAKGDTGWNSFPWFLPDGRHFLYGAQNPGGVTIRAGSLDGTAGEGKTLAEATTNAIYAQGFLLFTRESTLLAQPFDDRRLVTMGEAVPVAEQILRVASGGVAGAFCASTGGLLLYQTGIGTGDQTLTWFDRSGNPLGTIGGAEYFLGTQFSPDRKSLMASITDRSARNMSLWVYDVARGLKTRFTLGPQSYLDPIWSPDGSMVVFMSYRRGVEGNLYRKQVNVAGEEELLYRDGLRNIPTSWSPDGKFILFGIFGGDGDISALPLTPERAGAALKPIPFLRTPFKKGFAQFSPDGRWVAYDSDESQRREIYVAQFPGAGGRRRISIAGGTHPRWRSDGKEIFYVAPDRRLMAAQVTVKGNTLEAGEVRPLFGPVIAERGYLYDVSADGRRFLIALEPKQQTSEPLTLMENWTALLKK